MICEIPLTIEQSQFAAEHHDLVYKFLQENHLPIDEFYDVVIFGYLRAVINYLTRTELQIYTFPTIGKKTMTQSLSDYFKEQKCQKRSAEILSIHAGLHKDGLPLDETLSAPDNLMMQLETELILHDLAKRVSKQQMDIVRMRSSGYNLQDIANRQNTSIKRIRRLLEDVRNVLMEICYE